jgi:dolichyl-phosphate-mannose--protein O-mannosyl transferase
VTDPEPPAAIVTAGVRRMILLVIVLGAIVHFAGLTYPRQVVFDEVHWGKSVSAYCCTGQRVFDIHPPHGKLLLTLGAKLGGYDGRFSFATIGLPYTDQPVFFLRLVPALVGIAIPPLFLLFLRYLDASPPAALLGALALVFDNAILLETRLILFDGILVASILASLVCLLAADRATSKRSGRVLSVGCGAFAGLAVGTKFTGLVAPALICIYLATRVVARRRELGACLQQFAIVVAAALVVYLGGWAIHFALLPNPGPADAFHPTTGHFFHDLWVIHQTMLSSNFGLTQTHPDASRPLTWPLMKVAPYFWAGDGASIYLVGNPVVWWGASLLFVVFTVNSLLMMVTRLRVDAPGPAQACVWLPFVGYLIAYLPFFGITRVIFLYHYLTPLVFSVAFVVLWLDAAGWIRPDGWRGQTSSYYATVAAIVVGFLLISPLTYGFSAGTYDEWLAAVIRSWR